MTDGEAIQDLKTRTGRVEKILADLSAQVTGLAKDMGYVKDGFDKQAPTIAALQGEIIAMKAARQNAPSPMQAVKDWLHIIAMIVACVSGLGAGLTYVIRNAGNEQAASISLAEAPVEAQKPPAYVVISGKRYKISY